MAKDKKEKKSKKEKKEKKEPRSDIKRMKGTIIPAAFSDFIEMMEQLGEVNHKGTISTFSNDDIGVFISIPKQGSTAEKISLFLNKSRGWEADNEYKAIDVDTWHTGDVRITVSDEPKSMKQAYKMCKEWTKAKPDHTPVPIKKKAKDDDDDDKPRKKKKDKKDKKAKKAKGKNGEDKEMSAKTKKKRKKDKKAEERAEA